MDIGNWTFIFVGCFIELVLAGTNHQSNPYMFKRWIQDNGVKDSYKKNKHTLAPGSKINTNPHPPPSPEVNDHYTAISKGVTFSPTTPFIQVYRRPLRNRTVFSQRGPPWKSPKSVVQPTKESDMPNSTFVGILTGATIVFMLVWLPCYLYSETCLGGGGRSDNTSNGSSDNMSDDLEESDHPPSYNEALSSRTVSSFSFSTANEREAPPPSYDSLNILIQDLDKRVCRVTASTSYYSYRPPSAQQTTRVSSSRSFHGTSSYFSSGSLYQAHNNLSRVHKPKLLIRSFSFFEQPTLSEVQLEDDAQSSTDDDPGGSSDLESGSAAGSTTLVQRASTDLDDSSIEGLSDVPNYPPPTYRDECGGVSPSSDSSFSSSLLTVIEVKDDSTNNIPHMQQLQDNEDDEDVIVMTV